MLLSSLHFFLGDTPDLNKQQNPLSANNLIMSIYIRNACTYLCHNLSQLLDNLCIIFIQFLDHIKQIYYYL